MTDSAWTGGYWVSRILLKRQIGQCLHGAIHIIALASLWPVRYPEGRYEMNSLMRFNIVVRKLDRINHTSWFIEVNGTRLPPATRTIGAVNIDNTKNTVNSDEIV